MSDEQTTDDATEIPEQWNGMTAADEPADEEGSAEEPADEEGPAEEPAAEDEPAPAEEPRRFIDPDSV